MKMQNSLLCSLFTRASSSLGCVLLFFVALTVSQPLLAQDTASEAPATAEEQAVVETTFIGLFKTGGWAMYPLTLLSMMGAGLIVFNFLNLRTKSFYALDALDGIRESLESLDIERARQLCDENPCVVTNIASAGLERIRETVNLEGVEKAMEEASAEELSAPYVYVNYLSIVSTIAPMVGMLGTVSGMISGFRVLMQMGMGDPSAMAGSISEAMITTAAGLIIAIPAMVFYFYFKSRYTTLSSRVARYAGDVYYSLVTGMERAAADQQEQAS
jgi:biopolymer transport protein ExbB